MKLVIDIDKDKYKSIVEMYDTFTAEMKEWGLAAIKNGKPLLKGHGRLIDADALIKSTDKEEVHLYEIALAPTIIDADKESEDD